MIMGIIIAATIPRLGGLTEASRLTTAARTVVMTARYARTMAVLHQAEIDLVIDLAEGTFSVGLAPTFAEAPPEAGDDNEDEDDEAAAGLGEKLDTMAEETAVEASRSIEDEIRVDHEVKRVTVVSVVYTGLAPYTIDEGEARIRFTSNGTCTPHKVTLVDAESENVNRAATLVVEVDPLGSAKVKGSWDD